MAAIFVASGQGEIAVNRPNRKAVRTGVVLLSSNVCNHSIDYFNAWLIFSAILLLNASG